MKQHASGQGGAIGLQLLNIPSKDRKQNWNQNIFGKLQSRVYEIRNRIGCLPSASVANTHNCTNVYITTVFNHAANKHGPRLPKWSKTAQMYGARLPKWWAKNQKKGYEENCKLRQQMHHHYFISSSTQILLCSTHCFELLVSTIIAICHCCIHSFVKSSEGAKKWRETYQQTNCPFISCKGMKKIGHLVCRDHAAALGVSIYNIACNISVILSVFQILNRKRLSGQVDKLKKKPKSSYRKKFVS